MNFRQNIAYFIRHLREKHRLSVRNQHTDREIWYMHISPLNLLAGLLALILILFILIASTVAYTPVLDLLPGYPGKKSRTMLVENIMRLDSLEQELLNMQVYSENIALIMAGRNPVTRNDMLEADSLSAKKGATVAAIAEDSLLRAQMETPGSPYSLYDPDAARKNLRSAMELFAPVRRRDGPVQPDRQPVRRIAGHDVQPAGDGRDGRNGHLGAMDSRRRVRAVRAARQ